MAINASQLEQKYNKTNNASLDEEMEWLEKHIDFAIEHNKDLLFSGYDIHLTNAISKYDVRFEVYFCRDFPCRISRQRNIFRENFYIIFDKLQKKYKEQGWRINFKHRKNYDLSNKFIWIKKIKSKSFLKSLFSKNRKEYSSVLTEMEKKYL